MRTTTGCSSARASRLRHGLLALGLSASIGTIAALPAGASTSSGGSPKPIGTTFAFSDPFGTVVQITLIQVVTNAPPKTHYTGLHGKGPVVGLKFYLRNMGKNPATLSLFSSVLYYKNGEAAVTGSTGATKLGPSLDLHSGLAPGKHREGWMTGQGLKATLQKIQSTLNGKNTGSWKP